MKICLMVGHNSHHTWTLTSILTLSSGHLSCLQSVWISWTSVWRHFPSGEWSWRRCSSTRGSTEAPTSSLTSPCWGASCASIRNPGSTFVCLLLSLCGTTPQEIINVGQSHLKCRFSPTIKVVCCTREVQSFKESDRISWLAGCAFKAVVPTMIHPTVPDGRVQQISHWHVESSWDSSREATWGIVLEPWRNRLRETVAADRDRKLFHLSPSAWLPPTQQVAASSC